MRNKVCVCVCWGEGGKKGQKTVWQKRKQETRSHPKALWWLWWRVRFNERYRGSKTEWGVGEISGHDRRVEEWLIAERERQSHADEAKLFLTFTRRVPLFLPQGLTSKESEGFAFLVLAGNYSNSPYCTYLVQRASLHCLTVTSRLPTWEK